MRIGIDTGGTLRIWSFLGAGGAAAQGALHSGRTLARPALGLENFASFLVRPGFRAGGHRLWQGGNPHQIRKITKFCGYLLASR